MTGLIVPAHAQRQRRVPAAQFVALLNVCWSEAKMSCSPSTRVLFLPIEVVMQMHVLQWLAVRGSALRSGE